MTPSKELVKADEYRAIAAGRAALDRIRENLAGDEISEFDLPRVKVPAAGMTKWEYPILGGTDMRDEIEGVVVFSKHTRSYWEDEYKGGNIPPDCSSPDAERATPREGFEPPAQEANGFYLCDTCQLAEWGSSKTGSGKGQACKKSRVLFMLTPERMMPIVLVLPPTSLQSARRHFLELVDFGIDQTEVITKIKLTKVDNGVVPAYAQATFSTGDSLTPEQAEFVRQYAAQLEPHFRSFRVEEPDVVEET